MGIMGNLGNMGFTVKLYDYNCPTISVNGGLFLVLRSSYDFQCLCVDCVYIKCTFCVWVHKIYTRSTLNLHKICTVRWTIV